jgi:hypothetical protein
MRPLLYVQSVIAKYHYVVHDLCVCIFLVVIVVLMGQLLDQLLGHNIKRACSLYIGGKTWLMFCSHMNDWYHFPDLSI